MKHTEELKSLSDDELLRRLSDVLARSRRVESELVAHIAEVDARRLYAREAAPSMFKYSVDVLHLSEAAAYLRITVARASRRHPALLTLLADGRLHLRGIAELAPQLTEANCDDLLARAAHKTKAQIKELVAEIAPKPDVAPTTRKLPVRQPRPVVTPERQLCRDRVGSPQRPKPVAAPPPKRAVVEPLAPTRYKVQFTASAELHEKLERLAALMPGVDLAAVIDAAVSEKLERMEARRFGKAKKPRKTVKEANVTPGSRDIPAPVKRAVCQRDGYQCTYVSPDGRRCSARDRLEFHHDDPFALGGDRSPENIRLLCRQHNAYMAELDYGRKKMDRYRGSGDRVGEPLATLELCPERVATSFSSSASAF
jgi:5-methylcytosine-specific restriction endonuclease McrA